MGKFSALTLNQKSLFLAWVLLLVVLPLGHTTALRNLLCTAVFVWTLIYLGRPISKTLPGRHLWLILLAWAGLSLLWSVDAETSFNKWRSDLLIPFLGYASAYAWTRRFGARVMAIGFIAAIIGLAIISAHAWIPQPFWLPGFMPQSDTGLAVAMPNFYPGVGDASAFALICLGPLLGWSLWSVKERGKPVYIILAWIALVTTVLASENRNALMTLAAGLLVAFLTALPRVQSTRTKLITLSLLIVAVIGAGGALEQVSRERFPGPLPHGESAAILMMEKDPRIKMWPVYIDYALQHPWIGIGFGRTLAEKYYHTDNNTYLKNLDTAAPSHAHNMLINWWLQVGAIGLGLYLLLFATLLRSATLFSRRSNNWRDHVALVTTIGTIFLRNMTDDFMIFGIATAGWVVLGMLMAQLEGRSMWAYMFPQSEPGISTPNRAGP